MARSVHISLANKCQILFGGAVILILTVALSVVWMRMQDLVRQEQEETSRNLAGAWLADMIQLGGAWTSFDQQSRRDGPGGGLRMRLIEKEDFLFVSQSDPFIAEAIEVFQRISGEKEYSRPTRNDRDEPVFSYARAIRKSDLAHIRGGFGAGFKPTVDVSFIADPVEMVLAIQFRSDLAERQLFINRIYIISAGLLAVLMAIGVFYYITKRIILSPVRVLKNTAEQVSAGDLNIRSDINTGDEFEHLSDVFNQMLENLKSNQDQLRGINKSLDLKLGELAEHNVALYEANKIKGEFLANVSHELRTPLNSIVGFAEVLQETLKDGREPIDEKRKRYASNIILSSRHLLDLINDLLDLAKIEAGRMDVRVAPMSVGDTVEGLVNLIRPQSDKKRLDIQMKIARDIPLIQTDASKFQQVIFNFLSNAVKFTPEGGTLTISARMLPATTQDGQGRMRVSVRDTGPGIAKEDQPRIFEKFTQLDQSVTREHAGTGLGLTISRELANLLMGEIELESEKGQGATFSLIIPVTLEPRTAALMPELTDPIRK